MQLRHTLTKTEIRYGILALTKTDGLRALFEGLNDHRFNIIIDGTILRERKIKFHKYTIWIGVSILRKYRPGDELLVAKRDDQSFIINKSK